jgi:hypothetical protein
MITPRPQANDNCNPADAFELQLDEVKRRFVAKIASTARGDRIPGAPCAAMPDQAVPESSGEL